MSSILLHDQCPFVCSSHAHMHSTWLPGKNLWTHHICKYTEMAWNVHSMLQQTLECRKSSRFAPQRIIDLWEYISLEIHLECILKSSAHPKPWNIQEDIFFLVAPSNSLMLQWAHVLVMEMVKNAREGKFVHGSAVDLYNQLWSSLMTERESVGIWLQTLLLYLAFVLLFWHEPSGV